MEFYKKYQDKLLEIACERHPLSQALMQAYLHFPRHKFVPYNFSAAEAYLDTPQAYFHDGVAHVTLSQPSFVLRLLDLLQLQNGHQVFEVGTGSGWNAALMSDLVGPDGFVYTMETMPELAQTARRSLLHQGVKNVEVLHGDGAWGWPVGGPYDRIIFTTASPSIPEFVKEQCKEGGVVLFVSEHPFGRDEIRLLQKHGDRLQIVKRIPCHFVPVNGEGMRNH